jgi:hypothetical protein
MYQFTFKYFHNFKSHYYNIYYNIKMNNFSKQQQHHNDLKRTQTKSSTSKTKSNKDINRSKDSITNITKTKTLKNAYNKNTKIDETKTIKKLQCQYCHMATSEDEVDKIKFSCLHKICFACVCRYFIHSDFQSFTIDGPLTARCPICKDKTTHIQTCGSSTYTIC